MSYFQKYLKYKSKYLELKKRLTGGYLYLSDYVILETTEDKQILNVYYYVYDNGCPIFYKISNVRNTYISTDIPNNTQFHINKVKGTDNAYIDGKYILYIRFSSKLSELHFEGDKETIISDDITELNRIWNKNNETNPSIYGVIDDYEGSEGSEGSLKNEISQCLLKQSLQEDKFVEPQVAPQPEPLEELPPAPPAQPAQPKYWTQDSTGKWVLTPKSR